MPTTEAPTFRVVAAAERGPVPEDHQGLVREIAKHYRGRGLDMDDLIGEGQVGLIRACELFDPDLGYQFSTYAGHWIKEAIRTALRDKAPLVRLPKYIVQATLDGQTSADAGLKKDRRKCLAAAERVRAALVGRDGDLETADSSLAQVAVERHRDLDAWEAAEDVAALMDGLPDPMPEVLRRRFGLGGSDPETLLAIGESLGVTHARVHQIEAEALETMRRRLEADGEAARRTALQRIVTRVINAPEETPEMPPGNSFLSTTRIGPEQMESAGDCPDCGRPYGKRRRCFHCKPGGKRPAAQEASAATTTPAVRQETPAPIAPPSPASPSSALKELDAMRAIAVALDGLDADGCRRTLAWINWHYGTGDGSRTP